MAVPGLVALGTMIGAIIVPLVLKVLFALGIGITAYTGINFMLDGTLAMMQAQFQVSGFEKVVNLMAYMNVDRAITMISSAVVARATISGLSAAGTLKKWGLS